MSDARETEPDLPFALRVPTDRLFNDTGNMNEGVNYVKVQVVEDPELEHRGLTTHDHGGSVITLREWDEQVFLHELLHVATAYCQPSLFDTHPPHGHDVLARIEVALWETGWRMTARSYPPAQEASDD